MSQAASHTNDPRMHALAATSTALAAVNAASAVQAGQGLTINGKDNQIVTATDAQGKPTATKDANAADKVGGITVLVSLGTSKSQSHSTQTVNNTVASSIAAGGDVQVIAKGAGQESDIIVQGSTITAGGTAHLVAQDELTLRAAANTSEHHSSNRSHSMSVGVGMELGAKGGMGITLAGSLGRGKGNGKDTTWQETHITAGHEGQLKSGSDTNVIGAIVAAPKVTADVGGHLTIASMQDTSTYQNKQQSAGGSVTFGPKVTGSVNLSNSNIKSDYASVSVAAEEMRKLMIDDSQKFAGVTDGNTILSNDSGSSAGVRGDGKKIGGTRIDLELLCGDDNGRCKTNQDGSLKINAEGMIEFKPEVAQVNSLEEFLTTPDGKKMTGLTGGVQGAKGTLFGVPYQAGSWQDQLVEAFAGTHDMVGGKLSGLYDDKGNIRREMSNTTRKIYDYVLTPAALVPYSPFATAELLSPEMWNLISVLLKAAR